MALHDGHSPCSGSPAGASLASTSSSLPMTMPWEWILENILDLRELSLPFLREVIGYIPQITEPRCSRLLQKVALRFLDEVVISRKVDSCDVPFIRFILKEQGVSNLRRIHSLKESFENDLILRVETEAVLTNLRCDSNLGGKDWADFEDTLDSVFPEDSCESRVIERRKELIAVLPDRLRDEPKKDLCDHLLGKYPLQELLRDLEHFIEDKRKFFKIKFLDQLVKDFENGVYILSSVPDSDLPGIQALSGVHKDGTSDFQVPHVILSGQERLVEKPEQGSSRIESNEGVPKISHDFTDPALDLHCATYLPGSTSASSKNDKRAAMHNDGNSDTHNSVVGANVSAQEDLRAEMSCRMSEVDKVANGLTNEINELVNDITKFAKDVHNAARFSLSPGDEQTSSLNTAIARHPVSIAQNSEAIFSAQTAKVVTDIDKTAADHNKGRDDMDDHLLAESEALKMCGVGDTMATHKFANIAPTSMQACTDKGMKRNANEIVDQFTSVVKKLRYGVAEEPRDQHQQREQTRCQSATDGLELRHSPVLIENDGEGPSKCRFSREREDTGATKVAIENRTEKTGRTYRNRIYLPRMSKDGQMSPTTVSATANELRQTVTGGGDRELHAKCYLCEKIGGYQAFCHGCPLSVHESCLLSLCMAQAVEDNCWYCFTCGATMAQEGVKKAKEDVKKAKEDVNKAKAALKKAEEDASNTQSRLAAFVSARSGWSRVHYQSRNGLAECNTHFGNSLKTRLNTMHTEQGSTENSSSEPEREERNVPSKIRPTRETEVSKSGSTLQKELDSVRHASWKGKEVKMQTYPQASGPKEELDTARSNHVPDSIFSRKPVDGQDSGSVPALSVAQGMPLGDESRLGTDGKEQSGDMERMTEMQLPLDSDANLIHVRSGIHEGTSADVGATNVATSGSEDLMFANKEANLGDPQLNVVNPGVEEGDRHDGDLEEVCVENKVDADGIKVTEQAVDGVHSEHISEVPDIRARPQRRQLYRGRRQIPGVRRRNLPWTKLEEGVLKEGVMMFSNDGEWGFQWKRVLEFGDGKFDKTRTTVDLKDKWRNMMKAGGIVSDRPS